MARKNFAATGSFLAEDRPRALDLLGFSSQLVFNTFHNRRLYDWEHSGDLALAYGAARAHNRGMLAFCAVDPRLLATCYVPLADFALRRRRWPTRPSGMGAAALLVASGCPSGHSPEPPRPRPVWARPRRPASRSSSTWAAPVTWSTRPTSRNGLPVPPDFHGGEENFRSVDYMGIPGPPAQTLATMIFDGVLERVPALRFGVIEQGAIWVPSWLRQMEAAVDGLRPARGAPAGAVAASHRVRTAPGPGHPVPDRGRGLDHRAGRARAVPCSPRTTPTSRGDAGPWSASSASLSGIGEEATDRFYRWNFVDLMGSAADALVTV